MTRRLYTPGTAPQERLNYKNWRKLDYIALEPADRKRALRLERVNKLWMAGRTLAHLAKSSRIDRKSIHRSFDRCVQLAPDGQPYGWVALAKSFRCQPMTRKSAIKPSSGGRGYAGAFNQLLETFPILRKKLIARVLRKEKEGRASKGKKNRPYERKDPLKLLYAYFIQWCVEAGVASSAYPLCRDRLAKRAVARFAQNLRNSKWGRALAVEGHADAHHRLGIGGPEEARILAFAPYDAVQIDGHRIHCVGTVRVRTAKRVVFVPISRITIITVTDVFTLAFLGYSVAIRREPKAWHLTEACKHALSKWQPRELTISGLKYRPDAGFPSSLDPALEGAAWAQEQIDNALINLSEENISGMRRRVGAKIHFGGVGDWERRPVTEMMNHRLEQYGFSRLVSSTGTGPEDPTIQDPNAQAVKHEIEQHELLELIDVVIANLNATKGEGRTAHKSPLHMMRDYVASQDSAFLPRKLPALGENQPDLGIVVKQFTVRGSRNKGRRPYIQLARNRYTSSVLKTSPGLLGQKLRGHINRKDISTIRVYYEDGAELGVLRAKGAWGRHPHTLEDREHYNSLLTSGELTISPDEDEVEAYHLHLAKKSIADASVQKDSRPKTSVNTTRVAEIQLDGRWTNPKSRSSAKKPANLPLRGFGFISPAPTPGKTPHGD